MVMNPNYEVVGCIATYWTKEASKYKQKLHFSLLAFKDLYTLHYGTCYDITSCYLQILNPTGLSSQIQLTYNIQYL